MLDLCLPLTVMVCPGDRILKTRLPGAPYLNSHQYHGYLDVPNNQRLHYWFVESQRDPRNDPVILWLPGGPECSSVYGSFAEFGLYMVRTAGQGLRQKACLWNLIASLLFLEPPADVGFSTSVSDRLGDSIVLEDNYAAVFQFFDQFPCLKANDFYIAGEPQASRYVSMFVEKLLRERDNHSIKFRGMAMGSGVVLFDSDLEQTYRFDCHHGLVDQRTREYAVRKNCANAGELSQFCIDFIKSMSPLARKKLSIDIRNIKTRCFDPVNLEAGPSTQVQPKMCRATDATTTSLNRADLRRVVRFSQDLPEWEASNLYAFRLIRDLGTEFLLMITVMQKDPSWHHERLQESMHRHLQTVSNGGVHIQLYYGDLDTSCSPVSGEAFQPSLEYKVNEPRYAPTLDGAHTEVPARHNNLEASGSRKKASVDKPKADFHITEDVVRRKDEETQTNISSELSSDEETCAKEKALNVSVPKAPPKTLTPPSSSLVSLIRDIIRISLIQKKEFIFFVSLITLFIYFFWFMMELENK